MPGDSQAFEACRSHPSPATARGEGLLHDARNLVGTIGLYCDLLSMPGVLKPQHRQYPEELRLLGARSKSLIDHLMQSLFALEGAASQPVGASQAEVAHLAAREGMQKPGPVEGPRKSVKHVNLRSVVERCSGLLSRVANGRSIEITYGLAAAAPVSVPEEAVERILVNLVRNAASALEDRTSVSKRLAGQTAGNTHGVIRILVGPVVSRVGEHKPWPFQRVRLVVEDAGTGMTTQQLERLMGEPGARSRGGHGIGFCVVRDLVAASDGEIRVISEPEIGTCVQIEWPIATSPEPGIETIDLCELPREPSRFATAVKSDATHRHRRDFSLDVRMEVTQR